MTCEMAIQMEEDLDGGDRAEVTALMLQGLAHEEAWAQARGRRLYRTRLLHDIRLLGCPYQGVDSCQFLPVTVEVLGSASKTWSRWSCRRLLDPDGPLGANPLPLFGVRAWGPRGGGRRW